MSIDAIKEIRELREADEYVERMEERNDAVERLVRSLNTEDFDSLATIMDCSSPETYSDREYMLKSIKDERIRYE